MARKHRSRLPGCLFVLFLICAATLALYEPVLDYIERIRYPIKFRDEIEAAADEAGLSRELLFAVVHTESGFDPEAVSRANAKGLMQLTDDTNDWVALMLREKPEPERIFEVEFNLRRGSYLLAYLLREFGQPEVALAAYNAGIGRVRGWLDDPRYSSNGVTLDEIPFAETREYVKRISEATEIYERRLSEPKLKGVTE